jgi:hypothetical protein
MDGDLADFFMKRCPTRLHCFRCRIIRGVSLSQGFDSWLSDSDLLQTMPYSAGQASSRSLKKAFMVSLISETCLGDICARV